MVHSPSGEDMKKPCKFIEQKQNTEVSTSNTQLIKSSQNDFSITTVRMFEEFKKRMAWSVTEEIIIDLFQAFHFYDSVDKLSRKASTKGVQCQPKTVEEFIKGFFFSDSIGKWLVKNNATRVQCRSKTDPKSSLLAAEDCALLAIKTETVQVLQRLLPLLYRGWTLSTCSSVLYPILTFRIPPKFLPMMVHSSLFPFLGSWVERYLQDPDGLWRSHWLRIPRACVQIDDMCGTEWKLVGHLQQLEPVEPKPDLPARMLPPAAPLDEDAALQDPSAAPEIPPVQLNPTSALPSAEVPEDREASLPAGEPVPKSGTPDEETALQDSSAAPEFAPVQLEPDSVPSSPEVQEEPKASVPTGEPAPESGTLSAGRTPQDTAHRASTREMELPTAAERSSQPTHTWDILAFRPRVVAEQITWTDAELFKEVVPQHCLGAIWSERKHSDNVAPTVQATVNQYNSLGQFVITTCLGDLTHSAQDRARRMEHWIQVAKECKKLHNFSSMHAIIRALQSTPLCRLKNTWDAVSKKSFQKFKYLCKKDSETSRILFLKARNAKFTTYVRTPRIFPKKWQKKGVVPFLGTILTDLLMLDATMEDYLEGNDINPQKRMNENQILEEIRMLQTASEKYDLEIVESFCTWFVDMKKLSVAESYALSCQLEPGTYPEDVPAASSP